jgi:hypothetical protein
MYEVRFDDVPGDLHHEFSVSPVPHVKYLGKADELLAMGGNRNICCMVCSIVPLLVAAAVGALIDL